MTTDLWMLLASVGLYWLLVMGAAAPKISGNGLAWAVGNRDDEPEPPAVVARTSRASANMLENLPIFISLVLVAHVSGTADSLTAGGAMTFFGGRVAHALTYVVGIPYARTASWLVSVVGMGIIAYAIAV